VRFAPAPPPSGRPDLSLALVQVLCRHGDRTSINPLPNETREHWRKHLPSEQLERSLSAAASPSPPNPTLVDQLFNRAAWHGQLTTQGVAQLTDTGRAMRRWLVDDLALLPSDAATAVNEGRVKVRSTGTKRTVQSAQSLISGLYPELVRGGDASATPIPVEVRERERESMFPNPAMRCARLLELMRKLDKDDRVKAAEAAAWAREGLRATRDAVHARNVETRRKKREEARKKAREMNGGIYSSSSSSSSSKFGGGAGESAAASVSERPERKKDKKDAHHLKGTDPADAHVPKHLLADPKPPSATAVWEPLQARANHGLPLPPGVGAEDLALIRAAAETRHVHRAASSEAASLAGGRLLRELADEAHAVVEFMRAERGDRRRRRRRRLRRPADAAPQRVQRARHVHHRAARGARRVPGRVAAGREHGGVGDVDEGGAFYTLVPIRPRRRGERRSLRTLPGASLRSPLAFNTRPRRLSTPTDAYELHPDIALYGTTRRRRRTGRCIRIGSTGRRGGPTTTRRRRRPRGRPRGRRSRRTTTAAPR
jgi:hypothetical protein